MKVKKSLLAVLAMSSVAGLAHADVALLSSDKADIEFYGILDATIGTQNHSASASSNFNGSVNPTGTYTSATGAVTGMFNGGISPSRWGIKGSRDLGNDKKAFFVLESGFDIPTGQLMNGANSLANQISGTTGVDTSMNGQLFGRQANFGLSDAQLGSIAFGRNYAVLYDIVVPYDPVQAAQLFSPIGFSGTTGGGGGLTEDMRVDNSIKYKNKVGDVNFTAMYKFGGVSGNSTAQTGYGLQLGYEPGNFGVQVGYEGYKDGLAIGTGSTVANTTTGAISNINGLTATVYDTQAYLIAAKYKFTPDATVKAGYQHFTRKAPSDQQTGVTAYGYSFTTLGTGGANTLYNYSGSDITFNIYWLGGDYNITPDLNVAVGIYDVKNDAYSKGLNGGPLSSILDSDQKFYSLLLDYKLGKDTDSYFGYMNQSPGGGALAADTSVNIYGIGLRLKF